MLPLLLLSLLASAEPSPVLLTYATSVPAEQKDRLDKDLQLLAQLPLVDASGELKAIYKLPEVTVASVRTWLQDRAHSIIGAQDPLDDRSLHDLADAEYPYPNEVLGLDDADTNEEQDDTIVMSNVGGLMYLLGKQNKKLIGFDMVGRGVVTVKSPRVGIFRIGPALFRPLAPDLPPDAIQNRVHSIDRLGTLFHEARHGDGHAKSVLFTHAMCPPGHDYDGVEACDTPANGAYRTGALFIRAARDGCAQCSAGDKDALTLLIADQENRILSPLKDGGVSPAAAGIHDGSLCQQLKDMQVVAPFCDEAPAPGPVVLWEDAPESL